MSFSSKAPCLPAKASASNVAFSSVGLIFSAFCSWKPVLVTSSRSEPVAVATLPSVSMDAVASFSSRPWATRSWMPCASFSGPRFVMLRPESLRISPLSAFSSPWLALAVLPISVSTPSKLAATRTDAAIPTPIAAAPAAACCHSALSNMPLKPLRPAIAASFIVRLTFRPKLLTWVWADRSDAPRLAAILPPISTVIFWGPPPIISTSIAWPLHSRSPGRS